MYSVGDAYFFLMEAILYIPSGLALKDCCFCGSCIRSILYRLCQYHRTEVTKWPWRLLLFLIMKDEPGPRVQHIYGESTQEKFAFNTVLLASDRGSLLPSGHFQQAELSR